ncbi:CCE_0567 family metalloprotein [Mesorhizobium sp. M0579]|uniref:CCE_0567 family metalloprotein n=1 Tax=Mesorhizobium sp. M0579 TaxID=2956962 RepID=UPI003336BA87
MGKKVRRLQLRALPRCNCDLAEDLPGKWTEIEEVAQESRRLFPSWMVPRERSLQ